MPRSLRGVVPITMGMGETERLHGIGYVVKDRTTNHFNGIDYALEERRIRDHEALQRDLRD